MRARSARFRDIPGNLICSHGAGLSFIVCPVRLKRFASILLSSLGKFSYLVSESGALPCSICPLASACIKGQKSFCDPCSVRAPPDAATSEFIRNLRLIRVLGTVSGIHCFSVTSACTMFCPCLNTFEIVAWPWPAVESHAVRLICLSASAMLNSLHSSSNSLLGKGPQFPDIFFLHNLHGQFG